MNPFSIKLNAAIPIKTKADTSGFFASHPELVLAAMKKGAKNGLLASGLLFSNAFSKVTPTGVTGNARKGWKVEVVDTPDGCQVIVFNPFEYLAAVDQGRKAAWVNNMPPAESLTRWVQKKLGVANVKAARRIAYAISKKKSQIPTPGQKFIEKAIVANQGKAIKIMTSYYQVALAKIGAKSNS